MRDGAASPGTGAGVRVPLWSAAVGAAMAEGGVATVMAVRAGVGPWLSALGGLWACAVMLGPAALLVAALGAVGSRSGPRRLHRGLVDGLGGGAPGHGGTALALGLLATTAGAGGAAVLGRLLISHLRADFAAVGIAVGTLLLTAAAWTGAALVATPVARVARWAEARLGRGGCVLQPAGILGMGAAVGLGSLLWVLPSEHAWMPAAAVMGLALGLTAPARRWASRIARPRIWATATLTAGLLAWPLLHYGPAPVRQVLRTTAPYTALGLGAMAQVFDRDGDGHPAPPFGSDCDDGDPTIHPGAIDIPGDGIDQSCSGADASRYEQPPDPNASSPHHLPDQPNIVMIMLDALRADRPGFAGYPRSLTPHLDAFREGATWFRTAYAPSPRTSFSLASLLTGRYLQGLPVKTGAGNRFKLGPEAFTVAHHLREAGYDTAAFTLPYLFHHTEGLEQGFRVWACPWPVDEWRAYYGKSDPLTTDAARAYLETVPADGSRPFFLLAHYHCAHEPYQRHAQWDFGAAAPDRYDSSVAQCDAAMGGLLETLDAREDAGRTVVLVFADHGEMLGEHGFQTHGRTLHEPEVRVPLLLRLPGPPLQATVDTPVVLTDLAPTVIDLAGLAPTSMHGWSLLSHLYPDQDTIPGRPLFLYTQMRRGSAVYEGQGILRHPLKYVRDLRSDATALYDVVADPAEVTNLAPARPSAVHEMERMLDALNAHLAQD